MYYITISTQNSNKRVESISKFFFVSIMGAILSTSLTVVAGNAQIILGLNLPITGDLLLAFLIVLFVSASVVYIRPTRTWVYGPSIGYIYYWLSLLLFQGETLTKGLETAPILIIFVSPIPVVIAATIGAVIGTRVRKK